MKCSLCRDEKPETSFNKNQRYCRECQSVKRKQNWIKRRDTERAYARAWHEANKVRRSQNFKDWVNRDRASYLDRRKQKWAERADVNAPKNRARVRRWRKANRGVVTAAWARRKAAQRQAVPKWSERDAIRAVYESARRASVCTGIKFTVDHTVPLISEFVCGLHCMANLAILPLFVNSKKGNRYWPGGQHENKLADLRQAFVNAGGVVV